jgi:probable HAF family extracellular repeat protein
MRLARFHAALTVVLGLLALCAFAIPAQAQSKDQNYTIIDLGVLANVPGARTVPRAITNVSATSVRSPLVAGMGTDQNLVPRPFLWSPQWGIIDPFGGLAGSGETMGINALGDFVGSFTLGGERQQQAFLASTRMSAVHFLPTLGGTGAGASDINNSMVIAGWSSDAQNRRRATVWYDMGQSPFDIGTLGGNHAEALAINSAGQVVGWAQRNDGVQRAFLHDPRWMGPLSMRDLGSLRPGGAAAARDVNDLGFIVGVSDAVSPVASTLAQPHRRATLWGLTSTLAPVNMGALDPRDQISEALAINNHGVAVGWSGTGLVSATAVRTQRRAFIWSAGQMRDLNELVPGSGWILQSAEDINDAGMIVGWGVRANLTTVGPAVRGFLLVPVQ